MNRSMRVGDKVSCIKAFTEEDVRQFSQLSTDTNPLHLDEGYAADSIFGTRIVHGMLTASLISGLIGVELPGAGSVYLGQTLRFMAPAHIGEEITASVEVVKIREDKPIVTLRTECSNNEGQFLIEGEAVVKVT